MITIKPGTSLECLFEHAKLLSKAYPECRCHIKEVRRPCACCVITNNMLGIAGKLSFLKENFEIPILLNREETRRLEWTDGIPPEAGWYLVTYLTNDVPPSRAVTLLWYNSDSINKWYIGTAGNCVSFGQTVTHWMELPKSAL